MTNEIMKLIKSYLTNMNEKEYRRVEIKVEAILGESVLLREIETLRARNFNLLQNNLLIEISDLLHENMELTKRVEK